MLGARNVVIYMADSIRWDHLPERIAASGVPIKTIAASSHTPTSLASMVSGLWSPQHGVRGFRDVLPDDVETVLDRFPNRGLSSVGGVFDDPMLGKSFNDTIYDYLFDRYPRVQLEKIEEPFGWFMRDPGGHAPYGRWDRDMNAEMSVPEFYDAYAGDPETLRALYRDGIDASVDRFEKYVLEPLRRRGILDDTLVVFLSDHGELLGEHGHVSQSYPICPELVYVPTVYIHPGLEAPETNLARHVDLPDTIAHLTGRERMRSLPGKSVFNETYDFETGYCLYDRPFPVPVGEFSYRIDSMWDGGGGHAFVRSNAWEATKLALGYLTKISAGAHLRRTRDLTGFKLLYADHSEWGSPEFSKGEADAALREVHRRPREHTPRELTDDIKQALKNLGYR
jgi:arylsulfatase A-like enzyme